MLINVLTRRVIAIDRVYFINFVYQPITTLSYAGNTISLHRTTNLEWLYRAFTGIMYNNEVIVSGW